MFSRLIRLLYAQKRYYRSEIQNFLDGYDETHELTSSQKAEIRKHKKVYDTRDNKQKKDKKSAISWLDDDHIR